MLRREPVLLYRCYAKVNLTLEVLGRRDDGYHDVASLVQTISLSDDLRLEAAAEVVCRAEGLDTQPEANLVARAAELLRDRGHVRAGTNLTLRKRIPVAAGLGGGSSDAAATLVGLNRLWGTRFGYQTLLDLAARLGSDVPFFLRGGAAVMRGRGEQLEAVRAVVGQWLTVCVLPHTVPDKTARLYAALEPSDLSDGTPTRRAAECLNARESLRDDQLLNAFARSARFVFPGLDSAWQAAEAALGRPVHLSGAGPALFALAADRQSARQQAQQLEALGLPSYATQTVRHARARAR
jgi:4-diphosphocytidyl-2-C-methyl-D-erythritol kinase